MRRVRRVKYRRAIDDPDFVAGRTIMFGRVRTFDELKDEAEWCMKGEDELSAEEKLFSLRHYDPHATLYPIKKRRVR